MFLEKPTTQSVAHNSHGSMVPNSFRFEIPMTTHLEDASMVIHANLTTFLLIHSPLLADILAEEIQQKIGVLF